MYEKYDQAAVDRGVEQYDQQLREWWDAQQLNNMRSYAEETAAFYHNVYFPEVAKTMQQQVSNSVTSNQEIAMLDIKLHDFSKPVELTQSDIPTPKKDSVVVKLEATPLLSYTRDYLQGNLPYAYPPMPFTPGTNAIGVIHEVGEGVVSLKKGQRVVVDCNWEKSEGVANPERVLIGLTGISANSQPMLEEFPNGTWREYGDFPAQVIMPIEGVDDIPSTQLVTLARFIVPFGGLRRMNLRAGETVVINGASGYFGSAAAMGLWLWEQT